MKYLFLYFFVLFALTANSQEKNKLKDFGKSFTANVTGTNITQRNPDFGHKYRETTIEVQFSGSITKSIYVGVQAFSVFTSGTHVSSERYFINGGFLHYHFLQEKGLKVYAELSFNSGSYCTCQGGNYFHDPFEKKGLYYIGLGAGVEYPFGKSSFYAHASFIVHKIMNPLKEKTNFNLYKVGVSYRFGKYK